MNTRSMTVSTLAATTASIALITCGLAPSSFAAAPRATSKVVINDAGDTRSPADDLRTLTVRVSENNLVIRAAFSDSDYGDNLKFWIDTSNKTRNYYGSIVPEGGYDPLRVVNGQGTSGRFGQCSGFDASYLSGQGQAATVRISLRCLGNPQRLRVATLATLETRNAPVKDSAPDGRRWTTSVVSPR